MLRLCVKSPVNPLMVSNIIRFACFISIAHFYSFFPVLLLIFLTFYAVVLVFDLLFAMFMVLGVSKVRSDFFFCCTPQCWLWLWYYWIEIVYWFYYCQRTPGYILPWILLNGIRLSVVLIVQLVVAALHAQPYSGMLFYAISVISVMVVGEEKLHQILLFCDYFNFFCFQWKSSSCTFMCVPFAIMPR